MTKSGPISLAFAILMAVGMPPALGMVVAQSALIANDEHALVLNLSVAPGSTSARLRDKELVLVATNRGNSPISLDDELLNPANFCRVYDRRGKEIAYLPGPPSSSPGTPARLIVLEPGESTQVHFVLGWLTDDRLRKGPYEIRACYDNVNDINADGAGVDRFDVCAPWLVLK